MKQLTVYKASAGSGKTFTLAVEYIKLVIADPMAYRTILAVTFTNKATEEMKIRILSQLYGIWKQLPDSSSYMGKVKESLELTEQQISTRAGLSLHHLLHHYHDFRIVTIDTFFQSVLRNLARELDLTANLRIGLNDYQVKDEAVNELIENLDSKSVILSWILSYIKENIDDEKGWNVIGKIKKFGENIFKDDYKLFSTSLHQTLKQKGFYADFTNRMARIKQQAQQGLSDLAQQFFTILDEQQLDITAFSNGKSGVCSYFLKLQAGIYEANALLTSRVKKGLDDPTAWVKKKEAIEGNPLYDLVTTRLMELLRISEERRSSLARQFKSADLTLKHMNQLRLLDGIEQQVRSMNDEANRFLLSDTQFLLQSLIQGEDSPFIFEKIGTQLNHIMIDEFQDTSIIQWSNFKVLLNETMSRATVSEPLLAKTMGENGNSLVNNMLVGDVKQSIYRWRSGDWRLLNGIEQQFSPKAETLDIRTLTTNYRSERHIIEFNNVFFRVAAQIEYEQQKLTFPQEAEQLKQAYLDVEQAVPQSRPIAGAVEITLLPSIDYQEHMLQCTYESIAQLKAQGVPEDKIAILVRKNTTIQNIADYFMTNHPDIHLVSDEAFRLDFSVAVNMLIAAIRVILQPSYELSKAFLVRTYQQMVLQNQRSISELLLRGIALDELLPHTFVHEMSRLQSMSLFELVDELYSIFQLKVLQGQSAYICAFYDQLAQYAQEQIPDAATFLEEWDNNIHSKAIQGGGVSGIRLITIHKSKGLEFEHVIMPFCDWTLEQGNVIWCVPREAPYNELPLIPIDFNAKRMIGSIYENDYYHEHLQNVVDNLNLLYVAFTRAGKSLTVFGKQHAGGTRSALIEQTLAIIGKSHTPLLEGCQYKESEEKDDLITFRYGQLFPAITKTTKYDKSSKNVFTLPLEQCNIPIATFNAPIQFKQSNKSLDFVHDEEAKKTDYISLGTILHQVFSTIRVEEDVDTALAQLEADGVLYGESQSKERLLTMLHKRLTSPIIKRWFAPQWILMNECSIVSVDPLTGEVREHRPDRVMMNEHETIVVDFKFGQPKEEYLQQIRQYMSLLKEMECPNVKGFLWFVYANRVEEVKY